MSNEIELAVVVFLMLITWGVKKIWDEVEELRSEVKAYMNYQNRQSKKEE